MSDSSQQVAPTRSRQFLRNRLLWISLLIITIALCGIFTWRLSKVSSLESEINRIIALGVDGKLSWEDAVDQLIHLGPDAYPGLIKLLQPIPSPTKFDQLYDRYFYATGARKRLPPFIQNWLPNPSPNAQQVSSTLLETRANSLQEQPSRNFRNPPIGDAFREKCVSARPLLGHF